MRWNDSKALTLAVAGGVVMLLVLFFSSLESGRTSFNAPVAEYGSDASTLLFEDYEGTTKADTRTAGAVFAGGFLSGQALHLTDTAAYCEYADTWWSVNPQNFQESGTIECYFRPDSFLYEDPRPFGLILGMLERPASPAVTGYPALSITGQSSLHWAISYRPAAVGSFYGIGPEEDPTPLNPGQWYHLAATWDGARIRSYVNNRLVGVIDCDPTLLVRKGVFQVGSNATTGDGRGQAVRGRIDRLRISARRRAVGEFPAALDVRIDTPTADLDTVTRPFALSWRAYATDTRPRLVDLYAETQARRLGGIRLASDQAESGVLLIGAGLEDTRYYFYAVTRAGTDSAWYQLSSPLAVVASPLAASIVAPTETSAAVGVTPASTESYTTVLLSGGGTTASPLAAKADAVGTAANYSIAMPLLNSNDTVVVRLWTNEPTAGLMLGLRRDTVSLAGGNLPRGIPNSEAGRRAFGSGVILLEVLDRWGRMIGDTRTTSYLGDSFAYTLEYRFSAATTSLWQGIGFNTAPGSNSFRYWFADTYGGVWIQDTTCTVTVLAGDDGGIVIRVAGLTRDLPGGPGGIDPGAITVTQTRPSFCLIERLPGARSFLPFLRSLREKMFTQAAGRGLVQLYYQLCAWVMS